MKFKIAAAAVLLAAGPAFAQELPKTDIVPTGDVAAGEAAFRQCATCHVVVNPAGETLAGRAAKTGPNLYGVVGRVAGRVPDFRYSEALKAAGEKGKVYDEATFVAYVQDPTGFLREFLGDPSARGNMTFKVRKEEDAVNLYAYLHSLSNGEIWPAEAAPAASN
ncbi:MAG: cytochrome C [Rhodobacteraceae bacterium]|nr:cytochrome C [Paracoccaceae bacterium]